jgi:hypothetical protein
MARVGQVRRSLVVLALMLLNFVVCGVGFLLANRIFDMLAAEVVFVPACYLIIGAGSRLWSKKWWIAVLPAPAGYLWGVGALKWAIHMTDTRGEYAFPMAQYILRPSRSELLFAVVVAVATAIGWCTASQLARRGASAQPSRPT